MGQSPFYYWLWRYLCAVMKRVWIVALVVCLWGCRGEAPTESVEPVTEPADSAVYGVGGEFGMSTFSLITAGGDTISVTRADSLGREGVIFGDAAPDDHYVMVVDRDQEALVRAVNLTELEKFLVSDYSVANAVVVARGDTLTIAHLSNDSLVVDAGDGRMIRVTRAAE